jgi:hypothetical protein
VPRHFEIEAARCGCGARFRASDPAGRHQYRKPCAGTWRKLQLAAANFSSPSAGLRSRFFNVQIGFLESVLLSASSRQPGELKFAAAR